MNARSIFLSAAFPLFFLTWSGCRNATSATCSERILVEDIFENLASKFGTPNGPVVARVDGRPITALDLKRLLKELPPTSRPKLVGPEGRRELLEDLLQKELMLADARKVGIECDERFQTELNRFREGLISQFYTERVLASSPPESDADLRAFFSSHSQSFVHRVIQASHIVVRSPAYAKQAQELIRAGQTFEAVARKMSIDIVSAAQGGKIHNVQIAMEDRAFQEAVAVLKVHEISPVFKTPAGYEIVRIDHETYQTSSYESVKDQVRNWCQALTISDRIAQLKSSAKIEIDGKVLDAVDLSVQP